MRPSKNSDVEIYDNGFLTADEKNELSTQDIIDLAIANYTHVPVSHMIPKTIYSYNYEDDAVVVHKLESLDKSSTDRDGYLWDVFINNDTRPYNSKISSKLYRIVGYYDDNYEYIAYDKNHIVLAKVDLNFVNRTKQYLNIALPNTLYLLTEDDESTFLTYRQQLNNIKEAI